MPPPPANLEGQDAEDHRPPARQPAVEAGTSGRRIQGGDAGPTTPVTPTEDPVRVALLGLPPLLDLGVRAALAPHPDRVALVDAADLAGPAGSRAVIVADPDRQVVGVEGAREPLAAPLLALVGDDSVRTLIRARTMGARVLVVATSPIEVLLAGIESAAGPNPPATPWATLARPSPQVSGSRWSSESAAGPADRYPPRSARPGGRGDHTLNPDGLSPREAQIVAGICAGKSNHDIARDLYLGVNTVKTYIRTAYRKMGVRSRSQAVLWGIEHGY